MYTENRKKGMQKWQTEEKEKWKIVEEKHAGKAKLNKSNESEQRKEKNRKEIYVEGKQGNIMQKI